MSDYLVHLEHDYGNQINVVLFVDGKKVSCRVRYIDLDPPDDELIIMKGKVNGEANFLAALREHTELHDEEDPHVLVTSLDIAHDDLVGEWKDSLFYRCRHLISAHKFENPPNIVVDDGGDAHIIYYGEDAKTEVMPCPDALCYQEFLQSKVVDLVESGRSRGINFDVESINRQLGIDIDGR